MRLRLVYITLVIAVAVGAGVTGVLAAIHANSVAISVNDAPSAGAVGIATTYPSVISVTGEAVFVTDVNVTLTGFSHGFSDDFDVLLQSPAGTAVVLMSDAGDGNSVSGLNLTFDDDATMSLPDETPPVNGTYKPTNFGKSAAPFCSSEPAVDVFPSPAPAPPPVVGYGSTLAAFNGTVANGDWKLYVVDDCRGDTAFVANGWSLSITSVPTAVGVRDFTGRAGGRSAVLRWRTGSETSFLGFNVYRSGGGSTSRVNPRLIPARHAGGSLGASYRLLDTRVRAGTAYTYRLQVVRADGTRANAGFVALRSG